MVNFYNFKEKVRNKILTNYGYLGLSKLFFIAAPMSLKFGINALNIAG